MSDTDDDVIAQLQDRRTRPRRKPPAHRPAQGTPTPPQLHAAVSTANDASTPPDAKTTATDIDNPQALIAPADDNSQPRRDPAGDAAPADTTSRRTPRRTPPSSTQATASDSTQRLRLDPDEPSANYAVRVRRTLDDLVAWRLAELRRTGVRCSKVELTEMLLWEIADIDIAELSARLATFRQHASR
jgi:hypothetical protein